jgi:hypothetical protein
VGPHIQQRIAELIECQHERTGDLTDDLGGDAPALVKAEQKSGVSVPPFTLGVPPRKNTARNQLVTKWKKKSGAPGRTRTNTSVRKPDFESGASTNSATGARCRAARINPMGGTGSTLYAQGAESILGPLEGPASIAFRCSGELAYRATDSVPLYGAHLLFSFNLRRALSPPNGAYLLLILNCTLLILKVRICFPHRPRSTETDDPFESAMLRAAE